MGIIKISRPPQNLWERIFIPELLIGLGMTIKKAFLSLWKKDYIPTYQYPEEMRPIAKRFRGRHELVRRDDGSPKCVACFCCQTMCTPEAISIVAKESDDPAIEKCPDEFNIDLTRCIFCGMCVEACPKDAIRMTHEFEMAGKTKEQLRLKLDDLLEEK